MNTSDVKKYLKIYTLEHEKKVMNLAMKIFDEDLVPFLEVRGYGFSAGMGSWAIWNKGVIMDRKDLPKHLYDKLTEDSQIADNDLGSLMPDYSPEPHP